MDSQSRERFRKIDELFHQAVGKTPAEWAAFLDDACEGDDEIRKHVSRLLAQDQEADSMLEPGSSAAMLSASADLTTDSLAGRVLGAYRLDRLIASGGMGAVWLGHRADEQFEKRVAVKLIKGGLDGEDVVQRFQHERQVLAALEHPNIARLLDGGRSPDGIPYIVMEYVQGMPIDRYCEEHNLSVDDRLRLFQEVCAAVQYAHRNLIIHRDLKPANVLVTDQGAVKLLDFGISKVLQADASADRTQITSAGTRLMTPAYASPEQVRGGMVTTATDVYALGVLLYRLLTGQGPYRTEDDSRECLERWICDVTPPPPSAVDTSRLRRKLAGDLDTIVLKALRKEPDRRYDSVEQFAADVQRFREGRPVLARPDSWGYRTSKFIGRNRIAVTLAAAVLMMLVGWGVSATMQANRIALEADRARRSAQEARTSADQHRAAVEFLQNMLGAVDPTRDLGSNVTVRQVLDSTAESLGKEADLAPATEAAIRETIGITYYALQVPAEAKIHLDRAVELYRKLHGNQHAQTINANFFLGRVIRTLGDTTAAEALLRQSLADARTVHGEPHRKVTEILEALAMTLQHAGRLDEAAAAARQALAMREALFGAGSLEVTPALICLGRVLQDQNQFDEAEQVLQRALTSQRESGAPRIEIATTLHRIGSIRHDMGDFRAAQDFFQQSLDLNRAARGADPSHSLVVQADLAAVLVSLGKFDEAERNYRELLPLHEQVNGADHPSTLVVRASWAISLSNLGKLTEAAEVLEDLIARQRRVLGEKHPEMAPTLCNLGRILIHLGQPEKAEQLLAEGLDIAMTRHGRLHTVTALLLQSRASALGQLKRYEEAFHAFEESIDISKTVVGPNDPTLTEAYYGYGHMLGQALQFEKGEVVLREAVRLAEATLPEGHLARARNHAALGELLSNAGRHAEAETWLRSGFNQCVAILPPAHPKLLQTRVTLGMCLVDLGKYEEAQPLLADCGPLLADGVAVETRTRLVEHLVRLYEGLARESDAAQWRAELARLGN